MSAVPVSPIRVLVKGSSTVSWVSDPEPGRVSHAYPRVIESSLYKQGWLAQVRVSAPLAAPSYHLLRDADDAIFGWDPDVIVLHMHGMEAVHILLPRIFPRHAYTRTARPGRWRELYRRFLLWPLYSRAASLQTRLERAVPAWVFRQRRDRVIAHVNRLIHVANRNGYPLVVIMGLVPPVGEFARTFPGSPDRAEMMNEAFRALVAERTEANVVWFDTADLLEKQGVDPEEALGDGVHFKAYAHEVVGKHLAEVVDAWAAKQSHLVAPSPAALGARPEKEHDVIHPEHRTSGVVNE